MRINHQSVCLFYPRYTGFTGGFNHAEAVGKPVKELTVENHKIQADL